LVGCGKLKGVLLPYTEGFRPFRAWDEDTFHNPGLHPGLWDYDLSGLGTIEHPQSQSGFFAFWPGVENLKGYYHHIPKYFALSGLGMKTYSITQGYTLGYGISPFQGLENITSATIKGFCHLLAWCGKVNSILPRWPGVENLKGYYYHIPKDSALSGLGMKAHSTTHGYTLGYGIPPFQGLAQ
jgi:hypothetical protein